MRHILPSLTSGVSLTLNMMWISVSIICVHYECSSLSLLRWSFAAMYTAPCCIGLCLLYLSRLSVSFMPSWKCQVSKLNSPLLDIQLLVYTRYFCPFLDLNTEFLSSSCCTNCHSLGASRWRDALECLMMSW